MTTKKTAGKTPAKAKADAKPSEADTSESTAAADTDPAPAVAPASGVGRYRVIKTGEEIRVANSRAAARVADGELERV